MSSRQALKASPGCAALAAQITAMSPTASVPVRCRQASVVPGKLALDLQRDRLELLSPPWRHGTRDM
jgi:hypothetical protein